MPNSITVVKIGGALVGERGAPEALWTALRTIRETSRVVLLHGGGPQATRIARQLGHTPRMVQGRRVTTDLDLDIVLWTLRGAVNARLVAQARTFGISAVGLSGIDDAMVQVCKRPPWTVDGETVDFGWVGDVTGVRVDAVRVLLEAGYLPVLAPLGVDEAGHIYNVNADTVAVSFAEALHADRLLLVAASSGVRRDPDDPATHLSVLTESDFQTGLAEGWIADGMKVKLTVAFQALRAGVREVYILGPDDVLHPDRGTRVGN